jgi:hypothetical protein
MPVETPAVNPADSAPANTAAPAVEPSTPAVEPSTPETPVEPGSEPQGDKAPSTVAPAANETALGDKGLDELKNLRKKHRDAEREKEYWRGVAEGRIQPSASGAPSPPPAEEPPPGPPSPPDPRKFEAGIYDPAYITARDRYVIDVGKFELKRSQEKEKIIQEAQEIQEKFISRINTAAEKDPVLLDALDDPTFFPHNAHPNMALIVNQIKESEYAPEIIRHLYDNRSELDKMVRMKPLAAARSLWDLEKTLASRPKPEIKVVSSAPPPITPVPGFTPVGVVSDDEEENLSTAEFIARRNAKQYKGSPRRRA